MFYFSEAASCSLRGDLQLISIALTLLRSQRDPCGEGGRGISFTLFFCFLLQYVWQRVKSLDAGVSLTFQTKKNGNIGIRVRLLSLFFPSFSFFVFASSDPR